MRIETRAQESGPMTSTEQEKTTYRLPTAQEALDIAKRAVGDRAEVSLENGDRFLRVTGCFAHEGRRVAWDILDAILSTAGVEPDDRDAAYRRCLSTAAGYVGVWLPDRKDLPDTDD
jgi:hypothetical protein